MAAVPRHVAGAGLTIWFTGLSSAGKTTLGKAVCEALRARGHKVELLDGDDIRQRLGNPGFTRPDRDQNVRRIGFAAELLTRHGVVAIVAAVSPYRGVREEVRHRIGSFVEVYVHAPMAVLEERDPKGIYRRGRAGELRHVAGIDDPYEPPVAPDVDCDTSRESLEESVAKVLRALGDFPALPSPDLASKLLTHVEVDEWVRAGRTAGYRIGFTCGSFDLMHAGHVQYLAKARASCDRLLVAVNSDASVRRYKSPLRPVNPERERMSVVAALASVDAVTILDEDRPLSLLLRWKPELYIKGGDYQTSLLRSAAAVEEYGGKVLLIPSDFATSTSAMIERIVAIANHAVPERVATRPARGLVLLDRDGTLIRDIPFLHDPAQVELMPGAGEGLAALQAAGFALAIVTNQQGIGLGYYTQHDFIAVNQQVFRAVAPFGVRIAKIYHCPHSAADQCACRKPESAMVLRALGDFQVPPGRTFLIGDTPGDMAAGKAAGCRTIYVGKPASLPADYCAADFSDAVRWILERSAE
jgi:adenylylsulfate kinase